MIRGRKRPIIKSEIMPESQHIGVNLSCAIHNRFDIEVLDAATGKVIQRAHAENVICSQLWDRMLAPNTYFNYVHYGTGNGTPASTDKSLFSYLGCGTFYPSEDKVSYDYSSPHIALTRKTQLSETAAVGATITEVGIGYADTASALVTHAMLKDMNGNTITITKTATDIINIYATVFLHWNPDGYDSGTIYPVMVPNKVIGGTFLGVLLGLGTTGASVSTYWKWRDPFSFVQYQNGGQHTQAINSAIPDGNYALRVPATAAYSAVDKTITITSKRLTISDANFSGGIGSVALCDYCRDNMHADDLYSPAIIAVVGGSWYPGTVITGEAIATGDGSVKDFATDFPFVQSGARIYVDGVEQTSGVTVDINRPALYNNMGVYFRPVMNGSYDAAASVAANPASLMAGIQEYLGTTSKIIYYNPCYAFGIKSFSKSDISCVEVSDDLATWADITAQNAAIPKEYRTCKYWRVTQSTARGSLYAMTADTVTSANNIHFDVAPTNGAVIAADYTTRTIAKDENHVFDFSMVISLSEKNV